MLKDSDIAKLLRGRVVVLTGAGISAESGLPTFRGAGGLYEGRRAEDLATPEAFAADPELIWKWYGMRIGLVQKAVPNAAHLTLAEWEKHAESFTLISSNVDDLHERAGSSAIHKLHGRILEAKCTVTGKVYPLSEPPSGVPLSPEGHLLRPNVVWFGEMPWASAIAAARESIPLADLFIEIGVSGVVGYGFTDWAVSLRKPVIRINPDSSRTQRGVQLLAMSAVEGTAHLSSL